MEAGLVGPGSAARCATLYGPFLPSGAPRWPARRHDTRVRAADEGLRLQLRRLSSSLWPDRPRRPPASDWL